MSIDKLNKTFSNIIEWSLLTAVFLVPIYFAWFQENYTVFDLNKSVLLRFCLVLIIAVWLVSISLSGHIPRFNSRKLFLAFCAFLAATIISTVLSLHPIISLLGSYERQQGLHNIIAYLLVFIFIVVYFHSRQQLRRLIVVLNISAAVICLYGLMQAFGFDFLRWSESSALRIFSTFGQPNFFGHYLVFIIPFTIYSLIFISRRLLIRSLFLVLLISEIICLRFTYSRGAWVAIAAAFFVSFIYCLWHFKKRLLALTLVGVTVFLIIFLSLPNVRSNIVSRLDYQNNTSFLTRVASVLDFSAASSSNTRLKYWQASWQIFKEAPVYRKLFGFGPDVQSSVFARKYQPDWAYSEQINSFPDRAHNNFFDVLLQFGLIGLLSLLSLIFFCVVKLYKILRKDQGESYWLALAIITSLLAYTVNNFFSFSLTAMSLLFFVLLAIAWRLGNTTDQLAYRNLTFFQPLSRWLITGMSVLFLVVIFYGYDVRPLVADYYYMQAKKAEAIKDCYQVLNNMENVMEWYPTSHFYARTYLSHNINCFSSSGSDETRKKIINNIIDQTKNLPVGERQFYSLIDLSHTYSILGYYSNPKYYSLAEQYYKEMLDFSPNITTTYQDYGRMKLWQAKYGEARKLFLAGIAITPSPEKVMPNSNSGFIAAIARQLSYFHYLIGLTYKSENNFDQAILEYNKAILVDPLSASSYKDLADIAYKRKNIKEAIDYNKKAFAIDPNNSLWPFSIAALYLEMGDKDDALRYATTASKIEPDNKNISDLLKKIK